ncbi:hypothetical protein FOA52_005412 [Chlamydomonas sp. UWO 241]|nr:hypothetical protein FOA52_005412 [Chlamydomonas sp. UWO 241]
MGSAARQDFQAFADAGITSWDCADHYGPAEKLIGRFLKDHLEQVPNTQVLTKLCLFTGIEMATVSKESISRAVDQSRDRLGLPSVDLMQLYWGEYGVPRYTDAVRYLGDTQAAGAVRHIGLTNFGMPEVQSIVDTGVPIASHQIQYSLLDTRPRNGMAQLCTANGISLLPYGVLAGGFLSDKYLGVPQSNATADTFSKQKYGSVIAKRGGWEWFQSLLRTLDVVAKKHGSNISNVASKWVLDEPGVAGVIIGARNASHVPDYAAIFTLNLDDADRAAIDEVLAKGVQPKGDCYQWERGLGSF